MHYSDSLQNCVYLLNKYRWMAGDITTPQIKTDVTKERSCAKPQRKMTPEEATLIVKLYADGKNYKQIKAETGRCYAVIVRTLKKAGVEVKSFCRHLTEQQINQICDSYRAGKRVKEIAWDMKINEKTVYEWVRLRVSRSSDGCVLKGVAVSKA